MRAFKNLFIAAGLVLMLAIPACSSSSTTADVVGDLSTETATDPGSDPGTDVGIDGSTDVGTDLGTDPGTDPGIGPDVAAAPTYTAEVKALLDGNCIGCHSTASPSHGIALDTYATAKANASSANSAIQAGYMPTGGPLSTAQKALFQAWVTAGEPE